MCDVVFDGVGSGEGRGKGRVHSKKKNYCEFSQLEGGVRTNFFCFHNFFFIFFNVLIHANMQRKNFSVWGGYPLT